MMGVTGKRIQLPPLSLPDKNQWPRCSLNVTDIKMKLSGDVTESCDNDNDSTRTLKPLRDRYDKRIARSITI